MTPEAEPKDYIAPTQPDPEKPCYLCKHLGESPDFIGETWCMLLNLGINDYGTCKHYAEAKTPTEAQEQENNGKDKEKKKTQT